MQLKVTHKISIVAGKTQGKLAAVPALLDTAGNTIEEGDPVDLDAGTVIHAGPISVEVESPFKFQTGDPALANAVPGAAAAAVPGVKPPLPAGKR
jgi:hypothetical protein